MKKVIFSLLFLIITACSKQDLKDLITDPTPTPTPTPEASGTVSESTVKVFNPIKKLVPLTYVGVSKIKTMNSVAEVDREYLIAATTFAGDSVVLSFKKNSQEISQTKMYDMGTSITKIPSDDPMVLVTSADGLMLVSATRKMVYKIDINTKKATGSIETECASTIVQDSIFENNGNLERIYQNHKMTCDISTGIFVNDERIVDPTTNKVPESLNLTGQWTERNGFYYQYDTVSKLIVVYDQDFIQKETITTKELQINGPYARFAIDEDGDFIFTGCVSDGCYYTTTTVEDL